MRAAYMMAYDEDNRVRVPTKESEGRVSAAFVIPTPPGFPILVPGQQIGAHDVRYLQQVEIRDLVVFKKEVLDAE